MEEAMSLDDFDPCDPCVTEARNRLKAYRDTRNELLDYALSDAQIIELMADYATSAWQEGYEDGHQDGLGEGYDQGFQDAEMEQ